MSEELRSKILKLVTESKKGVIIPVYVVPNSAEEKLVLEGDELVYYTTEIPEKGRANAALIRFLAKNIGLPISKIDIVYGMRERLKKILVKDIDPETLAERLAPAIFSR